MALAISNALKSLHFGSEMQLRNDHRRLEPYKQSALVSTQLVDAPCQTLFEFACEDSGTIHTRSPTITECASHLKLLHAFHHLKRTVINSAELDKVFGIFPEPRTEHRQVRRTRGGPRERVEVKVRDDTFERRREVKWTLYLAVATIRFLEWLEKAKFDKEIRPLGPPGNSFCLPHLPPIDILMVCHALFLNPAWLYSIERPSFLHLRKLRFPWAKVHQAISPKTSEWQFALSEADMDIYLQMTSLEPDLYKELLEKGLPAGFDGTNVDAYRSSARGADFELTSQLMDAVTRQMLFTEKMEKQLWLRSPFVKDTLSRSIERYDKFVQLFKLYPDTVLVPKLDIDLVWHTHQCSPSFYQQAMMERAGRMIDHNDKLGPSILKPGVDKTRDLFRIRFGEEYSRCLCWDCEALLSAFTNSPNASAKAGADDAIQKVSEYRQIELKRRNVHK